MDGKKTFAVCLTSFDLHHVKASAWIRHFDAVCLDTAENERDESEETKRSAHGFTPQISFHAGKAYEILSEDSDSYTIECETCESHECVMPVYKVKVSKEDERFSFVAA